MPRTGATMSKRVECWTVVNDDGNWGPYDTEADAVEHEKALAIVNGPARVAHLVEVIECQGCRFGERYSTPDEHRVRCHWPSGPDSGLYHGDNEPDWYCPRGAVK